MTSTFSIRIGGSAAKELSRLSKPDRDHVRHRIRELAENPLQGALPKGEFRGLRRLRVGKYRVIYEVRHDVLLILSSGSAIAAPPTADPDGIRPRTP